MIGVTIGGILGHGLCTGLAVLGGRMIAQKISVRTGILALALYLQSPHHYFYRQFKSVNAYIRLACRFIIFCVSLISSKYLV